MPHDELLQVLQASVGGPDEAVDVVVDFGKVLVEQVLRVALVTPEEVVHPAAASGEVVEETHARKKIATVLGGAALIGTIFGLSKPWVVRMGYRDSHADQLISGLPNIRPMPAAQCEVRQFRYVKGSTK